MRWRSVAVCFFMQAAVIIALLATLELVDGGASWTEKATSNRTTGHSHIAPHLFSNPDQVLILQRHLEVLRGLPPPRGHVQQVPKPVGALARKHSSHAGSIALHESFNKPSLPGTNTAMKGHQAGTLPSQTAAKPRLGSPPLSLLLVLIFLLLLLLRSL